MLDRDINGSTWQQHMKQYGTIYQLIRDEIGIWGIRCKNGTIQPYSIVKNQLVVILDFQTARQLTFFLKRLQYKARYPYETRKMVILTSASCSMRMT
ncbi:hypothetical protein AYK25_04320 [Thermoplasmatales archaeon SM1-50]|nr:MAG: hypothetical protein AYK25_04320 [Thermoplasmatales archaeon SM1-50]